MIQFRAGRKFYSIPGMGFRAFMPAAAALPPYLAGGVPAANCKRAYIPLGKSDLAASKVDLTGNQDAAAGTNPGFATANGWQFAAASSQYLTTGLVPTNTTSVVCRFSTMTSTTTSCIMFGSVNASNWYAFYPYRLGGTLHLWRFASAVTDTAPKSAGCTLIVTPTGSWFDGVRKDTYSLTLSGATRGMYIGANNNDGSPAGYTSVYIQAWWAYDIDLNTSTYIADLTAAAAAL